MTTDGNPWAKLAGDAALPLVDHCLDVGAVAEIVLAAWAGPLAAAAGRALTPQDLARLAALMAMHDLGKANRGFQARRDPKAKLVGHTRQVAALLSHSKLRSGPAAGALNDLIVDWGARQHFAAAMAHHGRPLAEFRDTATSKDWMEHTAHWWPGTDGDPAAALVPLLDALRARWPLAWQPGPPLPDAPRFVALFAGLTTLADWMGSDTQRFPVAGPHGKAREPWRWGHAYAAAAARGFVPLPTPDAEFRAALGFEPRGFQAQATADDLGPVALIEAETGSGKTEAALWRWLELRRRGEVDGLFLALPTRSAAVQLHGRVQAMLDRVWGPGVVEGVLAVPGYLRAGDAEGQALPDFAVRWDKGEPGAEPDGRWAAERAERFLAARVAVGTIDQALLATLPVRHALFRAGVLSRSLLVVDEVHASDRYMGGLLEALLMHHVGVGGRALLLSATLGADARARLLGTDSPSLEQAEAVPYPALSGRGVPPRAVAGSSRSPKRVTIEVAGLIDAPDRIAERAVAAARAGAAVLVVRNSVAGAVAAARAVEALAPDLAFRVEGVSTLHHGRFAADDRRRLDAAVQLAFGRERTGGGRVLVGTQTLEQSLDIDADYLVTDLAPMDVLLQRIGRLHRHDRRDRGDHAAARVLVLRPEARDLSPLLAARHHGLGGSAGRRGPYPDVAQLEATLTLIEDTPVITVPDDNRRLVERALHPEALAAVASTRGAAWTNHAAARGSREQGDADAANQAALDLSQPFRSLVYPKDGELAATRLGARDLLVDMDPPLAGPFGAAVPRLSVPAWMAGSGGEMAQLGEGRFRLGTRAYIYDRWGLHLDG